MRVIYQTCLGVPPRLLSKTSPNFLKILKTQILKIQWLKGFCGFLLVFGLISQISKQVNLVYSHTDSLPYHLFLNFKHSSPKYGQYTCLHSFWYGGRVIKKILGTAGDGLFYDKSGNLWIARLSAHAPHKAAHEGAFIKIGKPQTHSKDGRLLTPIKPGVIPQKAVFVVGNHKRSFDSRYQELGLIPEKDLQGHLWALM